MSMWLLGWVQKSRVFTTLGRIEIIKKQTYRNFKYENQNKLLNRYSKDQILVSSEIQLCRRARHKNQPRHQG